MNNAYLLLGGNLGKVEETFKTVLSELNKLAGSVDIVSAIYVTEPWGFVAPEPFLNQAIMLKTNKKPEQLLAILHDIETRNGRCRNGMGFTSRNIDIDILFYDDLIIKEDTIEVPHPKLHLRNFALVPMCEIAPGLVHPVFNKTIHELLNFCADKLDVSSFVKGE